MPEEHVGYRRLNKATHRRGTETAERADILLLSALSAESKIDSPPRPSRLRGEPIDQEVGMAKLTHFDKRGRAKMVDVSGKAETLREAVVQASISMQPQTFKKIMSGEITKGDVFAVARVAGIMAAKKTSEIIPMCHPLNLSHVQIDFEPIEGQSRIDIEARVRIRARTGVEMEALVAVTAAGLTIYDMCKAIDRGMVLSNIRLVMKQGGRSGTYVRTQGAKGSRVQGGKKNSSSNP
jgi:cyclic pyranopterin phosphate synthase